LPSAVLASAHPQFQSTPPRGGRPARSRPRRGAASSFNPRPRVGGDAPGILHIAKERFVSIHAPAWGATLGEEGQGGSNLWFQSTPPRGGRQGHIIRHPRWRSCFNPRPRVGGDELRAAKRIIADQFQSTPPRGGRPGREGLPGPASMFQSTPPRGGRPYGPTGGATEPLVSIHAPAWGATSAEASPGRSTVCFNPRPRVGGDTVATHAIASGRVSIHAPAWGATSIRHISRCECERFNPRPRVGGDTSSAVSGQRFSSFNPRPRVGGDGTAQTV